MSRAHRLDRFTVWGDIVVMLTNDSQIAVVKAHVFDRDEVTDVIALRYEAMPGIDDGATAELFVNVHRACQSPPRRGWSRAQELALYLAHGCDHLTGASDDTEAERIRMRRRELRWLREAGALGLITGLLRE